MQHPVHAKLISKYVNLPQFIGKLISIFFLSTTFSIFVYLFLYLILYSYSRYLQC